MYSTGGIPGTTYTSIIRRTHETARCSTDVCVSQYRHSWYIRMAPMYECSIGPSSTLGFSKVFFGLLFFGGIFRYLLIENSRAAGRRSPGRGPGRGPTSSDGGPAARGYERK